VIRDHGSQLAVGAVVLLMVLLVSAGAPPSAQAQGILGTGVSIPDPLTLIGNGVGSLLGGVGGDIAKLAVGAFDAIIKGLFTPIARFITTQLIGWLITVPNLTQGNVLQLEQTVEAMGGGLLGAVATISIIRYWVAGFAGGGDSGFSALEGLTRTVGAALFLAAWPWLFTTSVHLTNLFTGSLMGSGAVVHSVARLLAAGLGAGIALNFTPVGLFLNIAMAVAASLLFLGLLLVKIVVSISTILVFVGMPLAAVIWPVVPWVARLALRAFAVCLIVPVAWALCFAGAAAVSLNAISFNAGTVMNTLLQPLVAIVLLYVTVKLPMHLARVAMLGAAPLGGGFASRAVSYAAGSQIRDSARQHLPTWAGGQSPQTPQGETGAGRRLRNAATLAGAAAAGGTGAAAAMAGAGPSAAAAGAGGATGAAGAGAATPGNGRAYSPPPTAQSSASGQGLQNGLQTPSFAGREQVFANEKFEAQFRERTGPVSAEQARAALASLPEDTQRGIGQLVADHGAGAREHLAYQAMGEWSPEEREALRTLAAASSDVRAQAVDEALGGTSHRSGDAGGDVSGISDTRDGAPGMPEGHTQPGWSDVDTVGGPPSRGLPTGPPSSRSAGMDEADVSGDGRGVAPSQSQPPTPGEPRGPNPGERFPNGSEG
jgi:hypothetical protein